MSTRKPAAKPRAVVARAKALPPLKASFAEVLGLIEQARLRAYQAMNTEVVGLYWRLGEYISGKLATAERGEGVVDKLAQHLARVMPDRRGFSAQNLWRMRQLFDTHRGDKRLSPLARDLHWTHNLIILSQSKRPEEREFYPAHGRAAALGQARAGTAVPAGRLRARGADAAKNSHRR